MIRIQSVVLILIFSYVITAEETNDSPVDECGPNEIKKPCGGICEDSCQVHFLTYRPLCAVLCPNETSCGCADGFVQNGESGCIRPEDCPGYPNVCEPNEVLRFCGKLCQETCNGIEPCPYSCLSYETCGCAPGYYLNSNNNCVEKYQCPPTNQTEECPTNEYSKAGGRACEATCNNPEPEACTDVYYEDPCTCLPGYLRDPFGNCVTPSNCPNQTCPLNEEFAPCGAVCEPTCENPHPEVCPDICIYGGGCTCKDGFVRDSNGNCIREYECPGFECDINESLQPCGRGPCEPTCLSTYLNSTCFAKCVAGVEACGCDQGFVRNSNGNCIDSSYCPPNGTDETCPVNEHFVECGGYCEPTCEDPEPHICNIPLCRPGEGNCTCLPGYLRDDNGNCVAPSDCPVPPPPSCGVNEVAKPCGGNCEPNCGNYKNPPLCLFKCPTEEPTCGCEDGFVRNSNGNCVDPSLCPQDGEIETCPVNEYNKTCGRICEPSCSNPNPLICPLACSLYGGCSCLPGYLRDPDSDTCVQPDQCSQGCGPNAEYTTCGSYCAPTCSPEIRFCPALCVEGCFCQSGYVSSKNGCILPQDCPLEETCYSNQIYDSCGTSCPLTCRNYLSPPTFCNERCNAGCFCKDDGYVLTDVGTCVLPENCPGNEICPSDHMVFKECGTACPLTCANIDNPPEVCNDLCVRGCFCEDGYVQADDGTCVLPEDCPTTQCEPNQIYTSCGSSCPDTCDNYLDKNRICTLQCVAGCFCQKGFVNDTSTGQCVRPQDCPCNPTCGENELYLSCGSSCPDTCDNYLNPNRVCTLQCVSGCFCQEGYVRDVSTGLCVLPEQCTNPPQCGENEIYTDQGNGCLELCDKTTVLCSNQNFTGCFCKPGYLRDDKGNCVLECQCPNNKQCGSNEVYNYCGNRCSELCDSSFVDCSSDCVVGCFCQEGYLRDGFGGNCIPNNTCPNFQPCGPNESYATCGDRCAEKCVSSGVDCATCENGCFCDPGYRREPQGNCVPENECSNLKQCGFNEVFTTCGNPCDDLCNSTGISCVALACQEGCFCQKGYARGYNGNCIPRCECDNQTCGINEEYIECGNRCSESCDSAFILCLAGCNPGCFCQQGFLRDENGNCIPEYQCPSRQCRENEVYLAYGPTFDAYCSNNYQYTSPPIIGQSSGCFCVNGYARDENNNCIPVDQCPHDCKQNEIFQLCGTACPDTCQNLGTLRSCIAVCISGCFCENGYVRDDSGSCILPEECPPRECLGPNEVYTDCLDNCPLTCQNLPYPNYRCGGQVFPQVCRKGCQCDSGYARNDDGICIPINDCPIACRTSVEEYSCGSACDTECAHLNETCPIINIKCNDMCYCIEGYARNSNWECVPIENCDNTDPIC